MLSTMNVVPGAGVDFTHLAEILAVVAVVYIFASIFAWGQAYIMAGVTQRTVYRLRQRVDQKLGRLPLPTSTASRVATSCRASPTTSTTSASRCSRA